MTPGSDVSHAARRRIGWRGRLAIVGGALLVALLGAEIVLRLWAAGANPPLYELDAQLGWRHSPSTSRQLDDSTGRLVRFAVDHRGLRATPHPLPRPEGRRRALVLGDSFTQGSQVIDEELFTVRIERALTNVEVWNAGVGGYSTLQELRALPQRLAEAVPDLVVLVVYDNDFADNLMPYYSGLGARPHVRVRGDEVEVVARPDPAPFARFLLPAPGANWLYEHCAIYRALHKNVFLPLRARELAALEAKERTELPEADQRTAMAWLLREFAAAVRGAGAQLLLAAIPTREQARDGRAGRIDWLAEQCRELDAPFVSLLEPLGKAGAAVTYFAEDIHLTAKGHAVVAKALAPAIERALSRH